MKKSDIVTFNSWLNSVYKKLFKYHKWEFVIERIHWTHVERLYLHPLVNLGQLFVKSMIFKNGHKVFCFVCNELLCTWG